MKPSVDLLEPVEVLVHVSPVPFQEPADPLRRDLESSEGDLIPDRLRFEADVDSPLLDVHHPLFHGALHWKESSYFTMSGRRCQGTKYF